MIEHGLRLRRHEPRLDCKIRIPFGSRCFFLSCTFFIWLETLSYHPKEVANWITPL